MDAHVMPTINRVNILIGIEDTNRCSNCMSVRSWCLLVPFWLGLWDLRKFPSQWGFQWFIDFSTMNISETSRIFKRLNTSLQRSALIHAWRECLLRFNRGKGGHVCHSCLGGEDHGQGNERDFPTENVEIEHQHRFFFPFSWTKMREVWITANS